MQCHCNLAEVLLRVDRIDEARAELSAARELRERLARIDPSNRDELGDLGWLHLVNGELLLKENAEAAALADFRETLRIYGDLARKDPSFIFWHTGLDWLAKTCAPMISSGDASQPAQMLMAQIHLTKAECRLAGGARDLALTVHAQALPFVERLMAELPDDPALAEVMRRAAALRTSLGK